MMVPPIVPNSLSATAAAGDSSVISSLAGITHRYATLMARYTAMMMATPPTMARGRSRAGSRISPAMVPTLVHPSKANSTASSTEPKAPAALLPSPTIGLITGCPPSPRRKPNRMMSASGTSLHTVDTTCMPPACLEPIELMATSATMTASAMGRRSPSPTNSASSEPTFTPYPARNAG